MHSPSDKEFIKIRAVEIKQVANDLKQVYQVSTIEEAKIRLDEFEERWSDRYPHIAKSWRANREELITYFDYPAYPFL